MNKLIAKLLSILIFSTISTATIIDKIIYNDNENSFAVFLSSNIKSGEILNIDKIDNMVDNFKYAKSNNVEIKIEPSINNNMSNVIITNKKTNPLKLNFSIDNYGIDSENGKLRYTINTGLEGVILNEKLDITYTFVRPILPNRKITKTLEELEFGEELEEIKDKRKARRNEMLNINLSFPIKDTKIYLIYENRKKLKSILTPNENIYDIYSNYNKYEIKLNNKINKNINLIASYSYKHKESYIENVKISNENIHNMYLGLNSIIKDNHKLNFIINNTPSIIIDYSYKDILSISNNIQKEKIDTSIDLNLKYKNIYSNIGIDTDYTSYNTRAKLGVNFDISNINIDTAIAYNKWFKLLLAFKVYLIK